MKKKGWGLIFSKKLMHLEELWVWELKQCCKEMFCQRCCYLVFFFFSVSYLVLGLRWIILYNFTFFFFSISCLCFEVEMSYFVIHWTRFKMWFWILLDVIWLFMVKDSLFLFVIELIKENFGLGCPMDTQNLIRSGFIYTQSGSSKKINFVYRYCKTRSMSTSCYP